MRYLILSDIHANWEALQAVRARVRRKRFDRVAFLGDAVGYGASPNKVLDWLRSLGDALAAVGRTEEALAAYEDQPDRWLDLHWHSGTHPAIYTATLDVTIGNDAGVLGRFCTLIGEQNANISDLHFIDRKPDFFRLLIDVDVRNAEHLHAVMMAVELDSDVASLQRFRDLERRP